MLVRYVKITMTFAVAAFALLVAYNNISDYGSNFAFVQHVLSMDSVFPGNSATGRAITQPLLWNAGYWLIIAGESATGVLLVLGAAPPVARPARRCQRLQSRQALSLIHI